MKNRIYAALASLLALTIVAGCRAQQPPSPTAYTCPTAVSGGTTYTEINPPASNLVAASITTTSYKWTPSTVGPYCAIVQAWGLPAGATVYQVSSPSNVVQITNTATDPVIDFSWTAPATNGTYSSYTYILSYAAATAVTTVPTAPALATPTISTSMVESPQIILSASLGKR